MKAEIIAVGTELLLGQIVNTNAQFLAQELAGIGVDVYFQTVVGDNKQRLQQTFHLAQSRADLIVCTGGLGPTQDDLTKDALAEFTGRQLISDPTSEERIITFFQERKAKMVESNLRQALILTDSDPLPNETGLAVGVGLTHQGTHYLLLPGPPGEMKTMFNLHAKRWIQAKFTDEAPLHSKLLKFAGIGESALEHELLDLIEQQSDVTIAPYAKEGEVTVRLTVKAATRTEAEQRMEHMESAIRSRLGQHLYADQDIGIEETVVQLLIKKGLTLSSAESCTGGLFAETVTSVPGSSQVFIGGMVAYTNQMKQQLGIPASMLTAEGAPGAVSEETATLLAERMREKTDSDFSISFTGVAGPAMSEGKPVGLVYVGIASKHGPSETYELRLNGNRELIRIKAVKHALYRVWRKLEEY